METLDIDYDFMPEIKKDFSLIKIIVFSVAGLGIASFILVKSYKTKKKSLK